MRTLAGVDADSYRGTKHPQAFSWWVENFAPSGVTYARSGRTKHFYRGTTRPRQTWTKHKQLSESGVNATRPRVFPPERGFLVLWTADIEANTVALVMKII